MEENVCLSEILNGQCCCKCDHRDKDGQTCCAGMYVVKEHGYCQGFKENRKQGGKVK
jgi:hypothetical protein